MCLVMLKSTSTSIIEVNDRLLVSVKVAVFSQEKYCLATSYQRPPRHLQPCSIGFTTSLL
jgi:hypothetical protein